MDLQQGCRGWRGAHVRVRLGSGSDALLAGGVRSSTCRAVPRRHLNGQSRRSSDLRFRTENKFLYLRLGKTEDACATESGSGARALIGKGTNVYRRKASWPGGPAPAASGRRETPARRKVLPAAMEAVRHPLRPRGLIRLHDSIAVHGTPEVPSSVRPVVRLIRLIMDLIDIYNASTSARA